MQSALHRVKHNNALRIVTERYRPPIKTAEKREPVVDLARAERLRRARLHAGFETAREGGEALRRRGAPQLVTYRSWENANRSIPARWFTLICEVFGVELAWLEAGRGRMTARARRQVPIGGIMVALFEIASLPADFAPELIDLPEFTNEDWIGYRIVSDANSPFFDDGDVILVRPGPGPAPETLINKLCVVTMGDGRRWVRRLLRGARAGRAGSRLSDAQLVDATPI